MTWFWLLHLHVCLFVCFYRIFILLCKSIIFSDSDIRWLQSVLWICKLKSIMWKASAALTAATTFLLKDNTHLLCSQTCWGPAAGLALGSELFSHSSSWRSDASVSELWPASCWVLLWDITKTFGISTALWAMAFSVVGHEIIPYNVTMLFSNFPSWMGFFFLRMLTQVLEQLKLNAVSIMWFAVHSIAMLISQVFLIQNLYRLCRRRHVIYVQGIIPIIIVIAQVLYHNSMTAQAQWL